MVAPEELGWKVIRVMPESTAAQPARRSVLATTDQACWAEGECLGLCGIDWVSSVVKKALVRVRWTRPGCRVAIVFTLAKNAIFEPIILLAHTW